MLNRKGGHPGANATNGAIRRWTAPFTGRIALSGELEHPAEAGDGIKARIVSSRQGQLQEWDVFHRKQATALVEVEVRRGETLDFLVEPRADENSDGFTWAPVIRRLESASTGSSDWRAARDFGGPQSLPVPLDSWQQYAQVLLSANEFIFID